MEEGREADPCHVNVRDLSKGQARKFFKNSVAEKLAMFRVCDPDLGIRELVIGDLPEDPDLASSSPVETA